MSLEAAIHGALSGTGADVNASRQLKIVPETDASANPENVGGMRTFSEVDPGAVTGTPKLMSPEVSGDYRTRVGVDTILFNDDFAATAQNTSNWSYAFSTLTAAQPGAGTLNFGVVQGTTASHGAFMRTFDYFPIYGTSAIWHESRWGMVTAALVANEVWSAGFGFPTAVTGLPADGAWLQLTTAGLIGRVCTGGVFTDSGVLKAFGDFNVGTLYRFLIRVSKEEAQWWIDDGADIYLLGTTPIPAGNAQLYQQGSLPAFFMKHNTGNVSNTNTMRVGQIVVSQADLATNKPWAHQLAFAGQSLYVGQNGNTMGKTSWWTQNTAPTPAAATNTAAIAGATTLGGLVSVQPTLTANNDGNLFIFTNPSPGTNTPGKNAVITGVKVQGAVAATLTGGPVIFAYGLAYGHTADSLATPETASFATATTHAPRVVFIGMESYAANAAAGVLGQGCVLDLSNGPVVVRPGERVALIARNIGTVTSGGHITVGFQPIGYWE